MTASDRLERLERFEDFFSTPEYVIRNALTVYAERMQSDGDKFMAQYKAIKDKPELREQQDQSMITTEGVRMAAEMVMEAAQRADKTRQALADLLDGDDDE